MRYLYAIGLAIILLLVNLQPASATTHYNRPAPKCYEDQVCYYQPSRPDDHRGCDDSASTMRLCGWE